MNVYKKNAKSKKVKNASNSNGILGLSCRTRPHYSRRALSAANIVFCLFVQQCSVVFVCVSVCITEQVLR